MRAFLAPKSGTAVAQQTVPMSLLAELDDPQKFIVDPEAVVVDEHTQYEIGADGKATDKIVRVFDRAYLEKLAANNNRRDQEGAPCAMTIGHTIDDAPETEQPPVVGYWRKHRVAWSDKHKRYCLFATPYLMAKHAAEARTYPRASIEHWRRAEILDPIAILRRTPERATQWHFAMDDRRWKPFGGTPSVPMQPMVERPYRYAMETEAPPVPPAEPPGMDPTKQPSAAAPDQEEVEKWMKCCMHCFPNLKDMHDKHGMAAPSLAAPGAAMTTPAATPEPTKDKDKDKFAAVDVELAAAKAQNAALAAEIKALRDSHGLLERQLRETARKGDLDKLAMTRDFTVAEELAEVVDLPADKYAAHLKRIETRYQKKPVDPTAGALLDTEGKTVAQFDTAALERATQYQKANHDKLQKLPFEERMEKIKRYAMTGKE
jgi:hypothetical protein